MSNRICTLCRHPVNGHGWRGPSPRLHAQYRWGLQTLPRTGFEASAPWPLFRLTRRPLPLQYGLAMATMRCRPGHPQKSGRGAHPIQARQRPE